jgi:hypothetical protein
MGNGTINYARVGVFLGYSNDTTKHIKVYSPELGFTSRSSRVIIDETKRGGDLDLRLRNCTARLQGPQNVVPDRKPRGRLKMEKPIHPISPLTIIPTVPVVAPELFKSHPDSVTNNTDYDKGNTKLDVKLLTYFDLLKLVHNK